ncbi:hypothetical protein [Spirosoma koreense]
MDKKVTTIAGIALGASLLAGAGYGLYKYFSKKSKESSQTGSSAGSGNRIGKLFDGYIGSGLIKSNNLYGWGNGDSALVGGGLYKAS